jgi:hypothetical protein
MKFPAKGFVGSFIFHLLLDNDRQVLLCKSLKTYSQLNKGSPMRPGREIDTRIAKEVFGYQIKVKNKALYEMASKGERPLRQYSKNIEWAWEVVEKMNITLIPIENQQWFALVGNSEAWKSPAEFLQYMQAGQFLDVGAAVGEEAPLTICMAALRAVENRAKARDQIQAADSQQDSVATTH